MGHDGEAEAENRFEKTFAYLKAAFEDQVAHDAATRGEEKPREVYGPPVSLQQHANNLEKTGWAFVVPEGMREDDLPAPLKALKQRRCEQMDRDYRLYEYRAGESVAEFLQREGGGSVGFSAMKPRIIPYYLCLVGSPEEIPWDFQAALDMEYAVGRIHFDEATDLESYVEHLLKRDTVDDYKGPTLEPKAAPVAVFVPEERLEIVYTHLMPVLEQWAEEEYGAEGPPPLWLLKQGATRDALLSALQRQPATSARLVLSLSHGREVAYSPAMDAAAREELLKKYGAVVCAGAVDCGGADLESSVSPIPGDIWYAFACFSAGGEKESWWPIRDAEWDAGVVPMRRQIAPKAFVAHLPQKALAAGLAAFIGHVSKAWDYSFLGLEGKVVQPMLFEDPLTALAVQGQRVGHAFDVVGGTRGAQIAATLYAASQEAFAENATLKAKAVFVSNYLAWNDARFTVILGDPAARLRGA